MNFRILAALALVALRAGDAQTHDGAPHARDHLAANARAELVRRGEVALGAGDARAATELFERAGNMAHEADAELGLVRAMLQEGHYRRALGFAAHVAGVHADESAGPALYAWLLHVGGQSRAAADTLARALARMPADPVLTATRDLVAMRSPVVPPSLLAVPVRLAPMSPQSLAIPADARPVASGILAQGGSIALSVAAPLGQAATAWVRNGLGQVRTARIVRGDPHDALVRLQLDAPFETVSNDTPLAPRDPFSGAPGFAVGYPAGPDGTVAWPLLRMGFLGAPGATPGVLALGIDIPDGLRGAPVFDVTGALLGVVVPDAEAVNRIVLPSKLRQTLPAAATPEAQPRPKLAPDEIYERALARVVQVLIVP